MLGPSLCCIYNALQLGHQLGINTECTLADLKECKKAVYYFLVAIGKIVPPDKMFGISDLYNNNTNGIVKVGSPSPLSVFGLLGRVLIKGCYDGDLSFGHTRRKRIIDAS